MGGAGPTLRPCPSLLLSLWPSRSPPPLSPAASSRAQWETDDTAEYVSSVLPPATDELLLFPRAVLCCDPHPLPPPQVPCQRVSSSESPDVHHITPGSSSLFHTRQMGRQPQVALARDPGRVTQTRGRDLDLEVTRYPYLGGPWSLRGSWPRFMPSLPHAWRSSPPLCRSRSRSPECLRPCGPILHTTTPAPHHPSTPPPHRLPRTQTRTRSLSSPA